MSEPTYFVTEAVIRNLKKQAERRFKGVRSAHMSEAVAAALGFRTHAALRSSLAGRKTTEAEDFEYKMIHPDYFSGLKAIVEKARNSDK